MLAQTAGTTAAEQASLEQAVELAVIELTVYTAVDEGPN